MFNNERLLIIYMQKINFNNGQIQLYTFLIKKLIYKDESIVCDYRIYIRKLTALYKTLLKTTTTTYIETK